MPTQNIRIIDHRYANIPLYASAVVECARSVEANGLASEKDAVDAAVDALYSAQRGEHDLVVASRLSKEFGATRSDLLETFWSVPEDRIPERALDLPEVYNTHTPEFIATGVARLESCHHTMLAYSTANKMAKKYERNADELVAMAYMGLQSALLKYNPGLGNTVSTFVSHRIRGSIQDGIRNESPVPKRLTTFARLVKSTEDAFYAEHQREPSFSELKDALGEEGKNLHLYPRLAPQESLSEMYDFTVCTDGDVTADEAETRESSRIVQRALSGLSASELIAVQSIHMDNMSLYQAAKQANVKRAVMESWLESGLAKLRCSPEIVGLANKAS